jgi:hypothetical protein
MILQIHFLNLKKEKVFQFHKRVRRSQIDREKEACAGDEETPTCNPQGIQENRLK